MIYLDNAATGGRKPAAVQNAVLAAMRACANPGRSGHRLSLMQAERVYACRSLLSNLFGGYGFERCVFTRSCTEALNLALLGVLEEGDHVILTSLEHNSVLRPIHHLAKMGVQYDVVPLTDGKVLPEAVSSLVRDNTKMCCVTSASNVTGETPDIPAIRRVLPEHVLLVVDGAQGGGHIPISMREWGADALALAGHKGLNAIQGIGVLLFSERLSPKPLLFGGTGSESLDPEMPSYYPDALESGTLSYPAICSLFEGALLVKEELAANAENLLCITQALEEEFRSMPDFRVYSRPNPCGIFSFAHEKIPSSQIADDLSERFDIAVRGGLHCAPLAHAALGTSPEGLVRASFSPSQGLREAEALAAALKQLY